MLDYTQAAGKKILNDIQKISLACSIITQLFYIFYLLYALLTDTGIFYANLPMLVLSCAYFAFFCYHQSYGAEKALAKKLSVAFKWSKRGIKLFNLGVMGYGIFCAAASPKPLSVVFTTAMAILWIADLLLEIIVKVVKSWWDLFMEGIQADLEIITKPANAVGNFLKKVTGKEVEESAPPSKKRRFLDGLVADSRAEKRDKKLEEKHRRQQQREKKAEEKRKEQEMKKAAKKAAQLDQPPIAEEETAITETEE